MDTLFKRQILTKSAGLTLLMLAACFLLLVLRAPLTEALAQQSPTQPADVLAGQPPCATFSERGVGFDFLGYLPQGDETTMLAWRITNPTGRALDAVGFTSKGWTPVAPGARTVYHGALGDYTVRWALHNLIPSHEAFFMQPEGDWFKAGAQETFVLTVRNFDPQRQLFAWVSADTRLTQVHLKPGEYNCLLTLSESSPTPTPTVTATPFISPLPTIAPDPALTVNDYIFSEPRVVMTSPYASLAILNWLPDNRRAIIMPGESFEIQTLDVTTGMTITYGNIGPTHPDAVWLEDVQKMAFRSAAGPTRLVLSDGANEPALVTYGNFRQSLAGRGNRVMLLDEGAQAPLLFDGDGNQLPVPPINVLDYGLNKPMRPYGPEIRWHPFEDKVVMADVGGLIIYDLVTGEVQDFDLSENSIPPSESVFGPFLPVDMQWSPDGQKLALELARSESMFGRSWLVILKPNTGQIQYIPLPSALLSDFAWAPNSRQLLVIGRDQTALRNWTSTVYFIDTHAGDYRIIDSLSGLALGGYQGDGAAWSLDGQRLLFRCRLTTMPLNDFGVCESTIIIGGVQ